MPNKTKKIEMHGRTLWLLEDMAKVARWTKEGKSNNYMAEQLHKTRAAVIQIKKILRDFLEFRKEKLVATKRHCKTEVNKDGIRQKSI